MKKLLPFRRGGWIKRIGGSLLLFLLLPSLLLAQSPISSVERINQIADELETIRKERELYLNELESTNEERKLELEQTLNRLNEREAELKELKRHLELFGDLIDQNTAYSRSLEKKTKFWRITSGILAAGLVATIAVTAATK